MLSFIVLWGFIDVRVLAAVTLAELPLWNAVVLLGLGSLLFPGCRDFPSHGPPFSVFTRW